MTNMCFFCVFSWKKLSISFSRSAFISDQIYASSLGYTSHANILQRFLDLSFSEKCYQGLQFEKNRLFFPEEILSEQDVLVPVSQAHFFLGTNVKQYIKTRVLSSLQ